MQVERGGIQPRHEIGAGTPKMSGIQASSAPFCWYLVEERLVKPSARQRLVAFTRITWLLSRIDFNQPSSWTADLLGAQNSNTRQSYSVKAMPLNRESDLYGATAAVSAGFVLLLAAVATAVFFRSYGLAYAPPTSTAETASLAVEIQRKQRGVRLRQVNPFADDNTTPEKGIDIIAVHGLDTRSPET
ncbi:peptidase C14, partial [Colletotrichum sojae]